MTDIRYTINDVMRQEIENILMNLYTSIPAIVESYDSNKQTIVAKVAVETPTYNGENIPPAVYSDIPVVFPSGSDWIIAGPLKKGDAVILIVPHYGVESYLNGNKDRVGQPSYVTRHDLNDAVAFAGMFTFKKPTRKEEYKNVFHIAQGNNILSFSEDNGIVVDTPNATLSIPPNGEIDIIGNVTVNGNLTVNGTTTTTGLLAGGINMVTHTHQYTDDGNTLLTAIPQ